MVRLKITFIGQASMNDTHGGATRLRTMINLLNGLGCKVDLVTYAFYSNKFSVKKEKINSLLQMTTICSPNYLPRYLKAFSVFPLFFYAWKSAKNCDLIFSNFRCIICSLPAVFLGKWFKTPVVLDYLDVDPTIPESIYRYIAKDSDAIFVITHQLKAKAENYGCNNTIYVPNFVDPNIFKIDLPARQKLREKLRISENEILIGYAGAFTYAEGVPILLQAFKLLRKRYPQIKLAIMGEILWVDQDDNIPKLIRDMNMEDDILLIPKQPYEKVPSFLSAFDILCCPKIDCEINRSIIPIKIIEYMSMGLPTVSSSVGGIPDTIEDGVDGILARSGDVENLEEKLEWIILNPECAKEIGYNGRKKAMHIYSYDAIRTVVEQSIEKLTLEKGS